MERQVTASGSKAYQRRDNEDRGKIYRDWHRGLPRTLLATDVDTIEWRYRGGKLVPVAVIEITRVDNGGIVNDDYLWNIINRFDNQSIQGDAARMVAEALRVPAYLVLFRQDCSEFWLYKLSRPARQRKPWDWKHLTEDQMRMFIIDLGRQDYEKAQRPDAGALPADPGGTRQHG